MIVIIIIIKLIIITLVIIMITLIILLIIIMTTTMTITKRILKINVLHLKLIISIILPQIKVAILLFIKS